MCYNYYHCFSKNMLLLLLSFYNYREEDANWSKKQLSAVSGKSRDLTEYSGKILQNDVDDESEPYPKSDRLIPRPSDNFCDSITPEGKLGMGERVYSIPKSAHLAAKMTGVELEDQGIGDEASIHSVKSVSSDDDAVELQKKMYGSLEELGDILVGAVIKEALMEVTKMSEKELMEIPEYSDFYSHGESFKEHKLEGKVYVGQKELKTALILQQDSDEDSVLNSDNDYEEGRDDFFRKKKLRKVGKIMWEFYYVFWCM